MANVRDRTRIRAPRESERKVRVPNATAPEPERAAERGQAEGLGGNQAVQRLARAGFLSSAALAALQHRVGNQAIQRLVYVPGKIVTTHSWLDKVKGEAVKQSKAYDEQILKASLEEFVGENVQKIVPRFSEDKEIYAAYNNLRVYGHERTTFQKDVNRERRLSFYGHNLTRDTRRTKRLVAPSVLWTGKNDLGAQVNKWYACVLISLLKVIGYDQIQEKYPDLVAKNSEKDQVSEMHRVFFSVKGKHYDVWSGNVPLYQQFGLRFIPIKSTWGEVHKRIPMPKGTYIFAFDDHMMALEVTTDLRGSKKEEGDAAWYQPYTSTLQTDYSRDFDKDKPINYLFYKP